jgi:hypothetical protein
MEGIGGGGGFDKQ